MLIMPPRGWPAPLQKGRPEAQAVGRCVCRGPQSPGNSLGHQAPSCHFSGATMPRGAQTPRASLARPLQGRLVGGPGGWDADPTCRPCVCLPSGLPTATSQATVSPAPAS